MSIFMSIFNKKKNEMKLEDNSNNKIINNDIIINKTGAHNEIKEFDSSNINNVRIESTSIDINVLKSNSNNITIKVYGKISKITGFFRFNISYTNNTLSVIEEYIAEKNDNTSKNKKNHTNDNSAGVYIGGIVAKGNVKISIKNSNTKNNKIKIGSNNNIEDNSIASFSGNLVLEISLPKKLFDNINLKNTSGDITINDIEANNISIDEISGDANLYTSSKNLNIKSISGDVIINSTFNELNAKSVSGNIKISTVAINDIYLTINSTSGDIVTNFQNIKDVNFDIKTTSGDKINNINKKGNYTANIKISTVSGDIKLN